MGTINQDTVLDKIREGGRACAYCGHSKAAHYPHSRISEDGHTYQAAEDEPIFILRAQDQTAVLAVQYWMNQLNPELPPEKYEEAAAWCSKALEWPRKKQAD